MAQWRPLRVFNLYRIAIATVMLVLYLVNTPHFLGSFDPQLYIHVSMLYILLTLLSIIASLYRHPPFLIQVYGLALADVLAITLLMYASGGATTGLGMLMIAAVAGASLLLPGRHALLFAAIAAMALLAEEVYAYLAGAFQTTAYTQAGMLGAALFGTAYLSMSLARRAKQSEALAVRRGLDLANLSELSEHIVNRMGRGIIVVDEEGQIRLMNQAAWTLLGNPPAHDPRSLREVSYPLHKMLVRRREAGIQGSAESETDLNTIQGLRVQTTLVNPGDEARGCAIYLEDAAEFNRQIQETKLASLGQLTASIAHEIRNPLGAISHAAQLLDESRDLEPADRRLVDIIHDHARRMNEIIQNILQLSRRDPPAQEMLALCAWLQGFVAEFERVRDLEPESITIACADPGVEVHFDSNHLHQVLWNLCTNAVKYGGAPGATPRVELTVGDARDTGAPYLDVIDHGQGVTPSDQSRLFEPFYTTSSSGTGLGLYISQQLCEKNGGALSYVPSPSGGSCFRVQFPLRPATAGPAKPSEPA